MPCAKQVTLRCIVGRRDEVDPTSSLIDLLDCGHIEVPRCHAPNLFAVTRDRVDMPPAIPLAAHRKRLPPSSHSTSPRARPFLSQSMFPQATSTQVSSFSVRIVRALPVRMSPSMTVFVF